MILTIGIIIFAIAITTISSTPSVQLKNKTRIIPSTNATIFWNEYSNPMDYLWNATFNATGDGRFGSSSVIDTSAAVNCTDDEVFLGNGSCWNATLFFDNTNTIDTSAFVNCSDDEVFLGNGSCWNATLFFDGEGNSSWNESHAYTLFAPNTTSGIQWLLNNTNIIFNAIWVLDWTNITITESQISDLVHTVDTSAYVNCSDDELFAGNGTCWNVTLDFEGRFAGIEWAYNETPTSAMLDSIYGCEEGKILKRSGSDWECADDDGGDDVVDTSAYVNCTDDEVFLGNGSCWNATLFFDNTNTIDTSAFVNCSDDEVFLGNGSCWNATLFYDGAGNASWNQSYADSLYLDYLDLWNSTFNTTGDARWLWNNQSTIENLTDTDCPAGQLVIGVEVNGTVKCAADAGGVDTSAYVNCTDDEVFLGNGSCWNATLFFDGAGGDTVNWSNIGLTNQTEQFDENVNFSNNISVDEYITHQDYPEDYIQFEEDYFRITLNDEEMLDFNYSGAVTNLFGNSFIFGNGSSGGIMPLKFDRDNSGGADGYFNWSGAEFSCSDDLRIFGDFINSQAGGGAIKTQRVDVYSGADYVRIAGAGSAITSTTGSITFNDENLATSGTVAFSGGLLQIKGSGSITSPYLSFLSNDNSKRGNITLDQADGSMDFDTNGVTINFLKNLTVPNILIDGSYQLPYGAGVDGQVLTTDGIGNTAWEDATGGGGGLTITSKSADYNASAGDLVVVDASGGNYTIKLPASPSTNDQVGVMLKTTSGMNWVNVSGNGKKIIDTYYGDTEIDLFVRGDKIQFQYDGTDWIVVEDRVKAHKVKMTINYSQAIANNVAVRILLNREEYDVGELGNIVTSNITIRRSGIYQISASAGINSSLPDGKYLLSTTHLNGNYLMHGIFNIVGGTGQTVVSEITGTYNFSKGDQVSLFLYHNSGATEYTPSGTGLGNAEYYIIPRLALIEQRP